MSSLLTRWRVSYLFDRPVLSELFIMVTFFCTGFPAQSFSWISGGDENLYYIYGKIVHSTNNQLVARVFMR